MDIKEMPDKEKVCTGGDLAEVLSRTRLSAEEAIAWKSDLEAAHKDSSATMTANEMVEYWSSIGSEMVHADDKPYLRADKFQTQLYPVPWAGPILSADVFLLFLNPGYVSHEDEYEKQPKLARLLRDNLKGDQPYFYLQEEFRNHPGYDWAHRTFGDGIKEYLSRICVLQLVAYHSTDGGEARKVAASLPSSKKTIKFVQDSVLARARLGKVGLVIARSSSLWGLDRVHEEKNIIIYRGGECRRAYQTPASRGGELIRQILARN
jgi:hypothetical protein